MNGWHGFPEVPADRVAQTPVEPRDAAKLLVLRRDTGAREHRVFRELGEYMAAGDVLVLNDTRVIPARLIGKKPTGGKAELLLLKRYPGPGDRWTSLVSPRPKAGLTVLFDEGLIATVEENLPEGEYAVRFNRPPDLSRAGRMPLPPYIGRAEPRPSDGDFYQTVYAERRAVPGEGPRAEGAVAAPTAGLHFTAPMLERLGEKGVRIVFLTLQVGWGTFRPVSAENYRDHRMLAEEFFIPEATARAVNEARAAGRAVWACGTTAVRTLESQGQDGQLKSGGGETGLYITPGYPFRIVDRLITNFHMPRHTPLLLAAAFAGPDALRPAYEDALRLGYRFFSYGDAMAIL